VPPFSVSQVLSRVLQGVVPPFSVAQVLSRVLQGVVPPFSVAREGERSTPSPQLIFLLGVRSVLGRYVTRKINAFSGL
jgi:hypothetical protein